jgi:hypothetical protein
MVSKLNDGDASALISLLKDCIEKKFVMPQGGEHNKGFSVKSRTTDDEFRIEMYRGKIDFDKHSIIAMTIPGKVLLLKLCVHHHPHRNPDGTVIKGAHLHLYSEEFGSHRAIPVDISSPNFIDDTMLILDRFNVIGKPQLIDGMMP